MSRKLGTYHFFVSTFLDKYNGNVIIIEKSAILSLSYSAMLYRLKRLDLVIQKSYLDYIRELLFPHHRGEQGQGFRVHRRGSAPEKGIKKDRPETRTA